MKSTFLQEILESTRESVAERQKVRPLADLRPAAEALRDGVERNRLKKALERNDRINIIAEIKRASPSKGIINPQIDILERAKQYAAGGACAISVLTEEKYFQGSLEDLREVNKVVDLPVLRKDFIVNEYQIFEAAEAGADAILLIVAALTPDQIAEYMNLAENELGLDAVVEVHTSEELITAVDAGASIIGINNRNLRTFEVTLDVSRDLIGQCPETTLTISESGITTQDDIVELKSLGFDGFLIGETLMRDSNPAELLGGLV